MNLEPPHGSHSTQIALSFTLWEQLLSSLLLGETEIQGTLSVAILVWLMIIETVDSCGILQFLLRVSLAS